LSVFFYSFSTRSGYTPSGTANNWELLMGVEALLAEDLGGRLTSSGYVLLPIPEMVASCLRATVAAAFEFFHVNESAKNSSRLAHDLGYRPFAAEYSQSPQSRDQVESFSASAKWASLGNDIRHSEGKLLYMQMLAMITHLECIAEEVIVQLAVQLRGADFGTTLRGKTRDWSFLQANYSRPATTNPELINDLHEDGCLVTLLSATGPGLELQVGAGEFMPITPASDQLLVIPGEIAWLLSGGHIPKLYHRVKSERNCAERLSLLYFADLDPRVCEPWVLNDLNDGCDIGSRVLSNPKRFGLNEWTIE
jgi:isopenicillin N synthase-like dioxygenase